VSREEKAAFIRERLESVRVTTQDYNQIIQWLSHVHTEAELDGILFWLSVVEEWPDAEFALPEFAIEVLRDQAEMDWSDSPSPLELYRGNMTTEKLKELWDAMRTARALEQRFMQEFDGESPSEFVYKIALSIFIENNRGSGKPAANGNAASHDNSPVPPCPQCGGEMWDNRGRKKNPKQADFRCKDKECMDESGYQTSAWAPRPGAVPRPQPKPAAPPPAATPAPVAAGKYDPDNDPLPF
jgi:hypothetical protein